LPVEIESETQKLADKSSVRLLEATSLSCVGQLLPQWQGLPLGTCQTVAVTERASPYDQHNKSCLSNAIEKGA